MTIFEHLGALMSFILSLAIAAVVVFLARLVRRRRQVVWSLPHGLWTANVLLTSVLFWIDSYRLRGVEASSTISVLAVLVLPLLCFLQSELVAPSDATEEDFNLPSFHARHRAEYIGAGMVYAVLLAAYVSWIAAINQDPPSMAMLVSTAIILTLSAAAIWLRWAWVQVAAPLLLLVMKLAYLPMSVAAMAPG